MKVTDEVVDRFAGEILETIHDMQTSGYDVGRGHELLPQVSSFSALHDYFDANVGWGGEFEAAYEEFNAAAEQEGGADGIDFMNAVFNRVDVALRRSSTVTVEKNLPALAVGDVIVDVQGQRHTVTRIGPVETFDDVWDDRRSLVATGEGQTVYTDTYPLGRGIVTDNPETVTFQVLKGK